MMAKSGGIRAGKRVRIDGLTKPEYNGTAATAIRQEEGKWLVKTEAGKELLLKEENIQPDEPERKRARFADEEGKSVETAVKIEDSTMEGEAEEANEDDPPYTTWANNIVTIRIVTGKGTSADVGSFQPLFTHQAFFTPGIGDDPRKHEELIIGYEEPKIEVVYAANTLKAGVDFKHSGMVAMKLLKEESLSRTNVLQSIEKRVPCDYADKIAAVAEDAEKAFTPLGDLVHEEPFQGGSTLQMFHFLANKPDHVTFVRRLQTFAIWMIETGCAIEVPDDSWNIFTLYKVEKQQGRDIHVLVGFLTAYSYWVYDKAENAIDKRRLRVSQCIVLPPFHRQGHGSRLLVDETVDTDSESARLSALRVAVVRAAYKFALADASIVDVSVEDPSDEFQALRDATDALLMHKEGYAERMAGPSPPVEEVARKLKLCRQQVRRLVHIARFHKLGLNDPDGDAEDKGPEVTKLRLKIKAGLYKQALCEHKGYVHFDHLDDEEQGEPKSSQGTAAGKKAKAAADAEEDPDLGAISQEDVQEALQEKMARVWGEGGDPYERKKSLRSMFGAVYKKYAAAAAKLRDAQ